MLGTSKVMHNCVKDAHKAILPSRMLLRARELEEGGRALVKGGSCHLDITRLKHL
jgi:hypothetical protein